MNKMSNKINEGMASFKTRMSGKALAASSMCATMLATTGITAFAQSPPTFALTEDMFKPLTDGITSNLAVVLPIGLGIFAIFIGIAIIPRVISKFTRS